MTVILTKITPTQNENGDMNHGVTKIRKACENRRLSTIDNISKTNEYPSVLKILTV